MAVKKIVNAVNIEHDDSRMYNVIPLRRMLVAPRIIAPVLVGREVSLGAVEQALVEDKLVFCTTQREGEDSDGNPQTGQLYRIGTVCQILQSFRLPDGNIRLLVEGLYRAKVRRFVTGKKFIRAYVEKFELIQNVKPKELEAYLRNLKSLFKEFITLNNSLPEEMIQSLESLSDPIEVFYFVLTYFNIDVHYKHYLFKMTHLNGCLKRLLEVMNEEIEVSKLEQRIEGKVKRTLNKMQREYYLQEQLKIIHKELGLTDEDDSNLIKLKGRIDSKNLSKQALDRV
ncbi:MAG: LON peptidase substrate-binding domain-containing protein, partial [Candidatus Cloacimonetes bacterium]|nr:LON peptidase substrate-binding domain-containing protein [Candidatus Cloacimonadota bacterium]